MSLREEIKSYVDGHGLVAPNLVPPGTMRGSDNGVMFTSEYYIYLQMNGEYNGMQDCMDYTRLVISCMTSKVAGLVARAPDSISVQPPDDYLGIAAACREIDQRYIAEDIFDYGLKNWGCYNNENPGKWETKAFLWRQPQLIAAMYSATRRTQLNPIIWVLNAYAALAILVANINDPVGEVDGRRLTFLLTRAMNPVSLLCRLASKVWKRRMEKTYGPDFMKEICKIYYKDNHPFHRYASYENVSS